MMYTLGLNAAFHDAAACLVRDGQVVAAAEEERFTRIKHAKRPIPFSTYELPFHAVDYCLKEAGIVLAEVDHVAYSFDPYLLLGHHRNDATVTLPLEPSAHPTADQWQAAWDPLFLSSIVNAPRHLADGAPHHLQARFRGARADGPYRWHFVEHHRAHAASAFYPSPFHEAAVLTLDGRGETATTSYAIGQGSHLEFINQVHLPHSLGLLYEEITRHLGFLHSSDEYKVMALASFGKPRYFQDFAEIVEIQDEGCYTIAPLKLTERFGPPRRRQAPLTQRDFDLASSLQVTLEQTVLELVRWLRRASQCDQLCLAGGVALNCVLNARLRDEGPFRGLWVQPAAGDAGTALGAALWIDRQERGAGQREYQMDDAYLGPAFADHEIESVLRWSKLPYRKMTNIAQETADLLVRDKMVGWFQGRMEFGPRALGARSILASPLKAEMQARLNELKDREDFRPVAPVVLEEAAADWFETTTDSGDTSPLGMPQGSSPTATCRSVDMACPFMLFVHNVREEKAGRIPAVCHVDRTARIQTVSRHQHRHYYDVIEEFGRRTGVPVLVNTSFNTRSEPIVCTPRDAIACFWSSPLDALVIGSFLLTKPTVT